MLTVLLNKGQISVVPDVENDLPVYFVEHVDLEYIAYKNDLELIQKLYDNLSNCYITSIGLNAGNGVFKPLTVKVKDISLDALAMYKDKRYNMFLEDLRSGKC